MRKNEPNLAIGGVDTAEKEPPKGTEIPRYRAPPRLDKEHWATQNSSNERIYMVDITDRIAAKMPKAIVTTEGIALRTRTNRAMR